MPRIGAIWAACLLAAMVVGQTAAALAENAVEPAPWMVAESVEVMGHSPHNAVRLYEEGGIDALGFRPQGGAVFCHSIEIWMADGRKAYIERRSFAQGEVGEFEMAGVDRRVNRVEFSCHPRFGVTSLTLEILVR